MTTPVNTDDIVQGAAKYLESFPDVLAVLGVDLNDVPPSPYLSQHELWVKNLEGSQSTALVVGVDGGWAGPNTHNTLRFPRLIIEIYVDPQRDGGGNAILPIEARRRLSAAFLVVDRHLHRPEGGTQMWGTVRTVSCLRLSEPTVYLVPDGDGQLRLVATYAVTQG